MLRLFRLTLLAAVLVCIAAASCGDEGKPHPGYSDPCTTPMSGALGCPAGSTAPTVSTPEEACRKLVACGVLAEKYLANTGADCQNNASCTVRSSEPHPGSECIVDANNAAHCHDPSLDYFWCVERLTEHRITDPCDGHLTYTADHVAAVVQCISATPCTSLGLLFQQKQAQRASRDTLDRYTCKDGKSNIWTATICDLGLLSYDSQYP